MPEPIEIYYDGRCRLCCAQRDRVRRRDPEGRSVRFVDIHDPDVDATELGRTPEQLRARMHARLADGRIVEGMEAVRATARALGRGWLLSPTGWPGLRWVFDRLYDVLARRRHLFGRTSCEGDACRVR